jgi:hypothetical protein
MRGNNAEVIVLRQYDGRLHALPFPSVAHRRSAGSPLDS